MPKGKPKYKNKDEYKIDFIDGVYHCVEDEGTGTGKCRLDYKDELKKRVHDHQNQRHYYTSRSQEQATRREQKRRAGLSLTSYIAERKRNNAPLLPILEDDSDEDSDAWEDEIPLQIRMDLAKLDDAEQKKYAENHLPYSANMFVSYVPEDPDIEPEATYDLRNAELLEREYEEMDEEEKKKYIFSFYAGTCSKRVCPWLTDSDGIKKSTILKLMAAGQVCWRKDFRFSGGTSEENKNNAMHWQHFYKEVNQYIEFPTKNSRKVHSEILNVNLARKNSYRGVLSREDKKLARRIGFLNKPLIPLRPQLLQQDPGEQQWIKHEEMKKRRSV